MSERTFEVNLPSGATVIMRPMLLKEQDRLLASKGKNVLREFVNVLNDCTIDVINWGPYGNAFPMGNKWDWNQTFEGDFFTGLLVTRAESLGEVYQFRAKCPVCNHSNNFNINLFRDLEILEPPEETITALENGSKIVKADVESLGISDLFKSIEIRLLTIGDLISYENAKSKMNQNEDSLVDLLYVRLSKIELPNGETYEAGKLKQWLNGITIDIGQLLLDVVDSVSFGVDTTLQLTCNHCNNEFELTMPFQDTFFRSARRIQRTRKHKPLR